MIKLGIKIFGIKELMEKLTTMEESVPTILNNSIVKAAAITERESKLLCPVDTGRLRSSIHFEILGKDEVFVGTDVEYAEYVEFGTMRQRPQPYMRPAIMIAQMKVPEVMSSELHTSWGVF